MGAKLSPEMKKALALVRKGETAYAAAKAVKITSGAIYKNADYRAIIAARKEKN